jgi:hypothetical protein
MALHLAAFSTWVIGALNGYTHKEKGIPASYSYTTMSLMTTTGIIRALGTQSLPITHPGSLMAGLFVGIPFMVGATFCTGTMMGKSIRHVKDSAEN